MNTTHEDAARPTHETAKAALSNALDNLVKEQAALSAAQDTLQAFNDKLDATKTLPKNAAHDGGELEAAVSFHSRRVERAQQAVSEAQANEDQARIALTEAQILDRAEALAAFDHDAWIAEYRAETQKIADRYLSQLYDCERYKDEAIELGRTIGMGNRHDTADGRVSIEMAGSSRGISLDGTAVSVTPPILGLDHLQESIRDTRADAEVEELYRVEAERKAAEAAERKAERELVAAYEKAQRGGQQKFAYTGDTGGRPMITRDQFGRPLKPMESTPAGQSKYTS